MSFKRGTFAHKVKKITLKGIFVRNKKFFFKRTERAGGGGVNRIDQNINDAENLDERDDGAAAEEGVCAGVHPGVCALRQLHLLRDGH